MSLDDRPRERERNQPVFRAVDHQDRSSDGPTKGSNVVDLMAALKKSLDSGGGSETKPKGRKAAPARKAAAKKAPGRKRA